VDGITAAAIGAIAGAVLVLAKRQFVDLTTVSIAIVTILLLLKVRRLPEPIIILLAAGTGLVLKGF
jgi:chromate transporter